MAKIPNCEICGKKFIWYRWRHTCNYCRKVICSNCRKKGMEINMQSNFYGQHIELCTICYQQLLNDYEEVEEVIVVRSPHVGGHKTMKIFGDIFTGIGYKDFDDARFELQYNAFKLGGNAVLNYRYIKHKHWRSTGRKGRGIYYYNKFTAEGTVAIVKKQRK